MTVTLEPIVSWYAANARPLPWRAADTSPWQVLVSEVMLQQTPVSRVLPVWLEWSRRWPTPGCLAEAPVGDAIRAWGRLGYPRRAVRLHASAVACVERHDGQVPSSVDELLALPGVGDYTAAAVAAFAFEQRQPVLDTNVRRVHARLLDGQAYERAGTVTIAERERALALLPESGPAAARASVAMMELGALVCTARTPHCQQCPAAATCRWRLAGFPPWEGKPRRGQTYAGTDRQCRGRILAELRGSVRPLTLTELVGCWHDRAQFDRALASLATDRLVEVDTADEGQPVTRIRLPG